MTTRMEIGNTGAGHNAGGRRYPMTEYDEIVRGHNWEQHTVFNNLRWCAGCGLGILPEPDGEGGLIGALLMPTPGETTGGCRGQQAGVAGEDRSYFLVNPETGGMDRVGLQDWLPRLQNVQGETDALEPAGSGVMDRRMRFMQGRR